MTATYTNDPSGRPIDRVRLEIDDRDTTIEANALLTDEEIQYYIDSHPHILLAAAAAADQLAAKFAGDPKTKKVGDLEIDYGTEGRSATFKAVAEKLRTQVAKRTGGFAGGLSRSKKVTARVDLDRVQPPFRIGQDDTPGSTGSRNGTGINDF